MLKKIIFCFLHLRIQMNFIQTLSKRICLVLLMAFAIVWSGVSIASNSLMHIQMSQALLQQMPEHDVQMASKHDQHQLDTEKTAQLEYLSSCHDQKMDMSQQNKMSCHDSQITQNQTTQTHCSECSMLLCQSMLAWVAPNEFAIQDPQLSVTSKSLPLHYQAQHLAGFWQEILRPPKA